jgi:hypothetical protein
MGDQKKLKNQFNRDNKKNNHENRTMKNTD